MRKIALLLIIALVQCGCAGSVPEPIRDTESGTLTQSEPITEEASVPVETFTDDETPFSVLGENALLPDESGTEETFLSDEPDGGDVAEHDDNWLSYGAIVPENWRELVPENWREILTTEEALENFHAIVAPPPKGASLEDEIVLLMNRNILCFDTGQLGAFELIDHVSSVGGKAEMKMVRVRSEYLKSVQDIKNLYQQTYTEAYAHYCFYGTQNKPRQIFLRDEDGILWVNLQKVGNWVNDPFRDRTYIEIVNQSDSICEFIWHYVEYDSINNDPPREFFPLHRTINGFAVKENGEWRLAYTILNNPELDRPTFKWRPDAAEHE